MARAVTRNIPKNAKISKIAKFPHESFFVVFGSFAGFAVGSQS